MKILIKLSGELLSEKNKDSVKNIIKQIKNISANNEIGIVVGGGNFFRGARDNKSLNLKKESAHKIGMLSTIVNGIILHDMLLKEEVPTTILNAIQAPSIAELITQKSVEKSLEKKEVIIFVAGTGNPFFTTDTNAILRGLQMEADEIWKATKVDGVYNADPLKLEDAELYKTISHQEVINKKLGVMDLAAVALAQEYDINIRVFNLFKTDSLQQALTDPNFGSKIRKE
jgi:uridylate kinase